MVKNLYGGGWCSWESIFNVISSVVVFMILKNIDTTNWNLKIKKIIKYISSLCLGGYLISWIFDTIFYGELIRRIPIILERFIYMPVMVLMIGVSSLALSVLVTFLGNQITRIVNLFLLRMVDRITNS